MLQIVPGTIIDERYQVVSRLGSGGMADVYCAEDLQLGRRVAVKLLHERFAQDEEFVERFRREASSAASLSHANIVSVFDRGEWGGTYYIAMELLEGRSLDAIVREEAPLTPERAIDITEQVLRAARFAHRRGVVHRDLKPHNVIIDDENRVKVTDFGIARAGASEITQTGSIMGTARYLSPEQAQGENVGPPSDVYAIGILLYELLTGTVPFEGESVVAIALRHLSEPPRPPSTLVSSISPNLDAIVLRALAKDPADRFADADDFLNALGAERERLRTEDGSRTAAFTPVVMPTVQAPVLRPTPSDGTQTLLPATVHHPDPDYWDSSATSVISSGPGGAPPPRRSGGGPVWPWALFGVFVAIAAIIALVFLLIGRNETVPSVTGEHEDVAQLTLKSDGFKVATTPQTSSTATAGTVIGQNPAPGSEIAGGSTVELLVSAGKAYGVVPDVRNQPLAVAEATLARAHFRHTTTQQSSNSVKKGYVISTTPAATSTAPEGKVISLAVSSGPQDVPLLSVVGSKYSDAELVLESNGFVVKRVPVPSSTYAAGTVIQESPSTKKAPYGSTVTLDVATAPTKVAVPPLNGDTPARASAALIAAGLVEGSLTSQTVTDQSQNGVVVAQTPAAGTLVAPGTTVTVAIGDYTGPTGNSGTSPTGPSGATGTS
ncbi:MAG: Stk1 family PASTA domain-containing Ser/Thr kinase [Solirubrobacteraceae bacterium]|jgi:serine/threonine-protein kinase